MPEIRGNKRGWPGKSAKNEVPGVKPLGTVRRSQLITTYGIGAIVDLEAGSFMPTGLEDWARATRFASLSLSEPRLEAQLGVSHFRCAPIMEVIPNSKGMVDPGKTTPAVRFPKWHECPKCHRLGAEDAPFEADGNVLRCIGCRVTTNPVRFVLACNRGHIADFPWKWWAHRSKPGGACDKPTLFLKSHGESAALKDLYVECQNCREVDSATGETPRYVRSSLGDAFGAKTFEGRFACSGSRPWLHDHRDCNEVPRALQRGASNVHFGVVASALSIPPASRPAFQAIEELMRTLRYIPESARMEAIRGFAEEKGFDPEDLLAAYASSQSIRNEDSLHTDAVSRAKEYKALCLNSDDGPQGDYVSSFQNRVREPDSRVDHWFDLVGAVSRLREVRALAGFSRIEPYPVSGERIREAIREGHISPLSATLMTDWLPAAEILGEGIFLRFRGERIDQWLEENPQLIEHARKLDGISTGIANKRSYERDYTITPRLLLVHSFAHALIRQLSLDCGYSMSSLRERLFVAEPEGDTPAIHGVLIYTGSPDSDGSLGGLVRIADPKLLEEVILRTVAGAQWCGSDPVCIETDPVQAGERVSGAACHSCLLLPETACEKFNRELDRAVLVGHPAEHWAGYFQGMDS
ncbi:DrmB family protein [Pseudomonas gingeri]|uniref:DrmB family protein n=1 Tax=Pseudomonas gingeri TaxID=117681 RepID=UPI0015A257A5|nr:DrmB family protein [Pseudomonas gingeri]NWE26819.1 DUF1998 domain-containing protein [Pseudomonas gingeri]NWE94841.1 DUF1998 domain-containing protein [Pseudomonas gingeri]